MLTLGNTPAIFYAPHQDDEAIGMAGAIGQHKELGHPVYLVLLSNGANRSLLDILNGLTWCTWHQTHHNFGLSMEQLCWARKMEFVASAKQLNVDRIFMVNDAQGLDLGMKYEKLVRSVVQTIKHFERQFPGASHHLVSGRLDLLPKGSATATNAVHQACWDAAMKLKGKIRKFRFYRIYVYWKDRAERGSGFQCILKPQWQALKQSALNEYKLFSPDSGRFAVGYHSVRQLMDAAAADSNEYLDYLPQTGSRVWKKVKQIVFFQQPRNAETRRRLRDELY